MGFEHGGSNQKNQLVFKLIETVIDIVTELTVPLLNVKELALLLGVSVTSVYRLAEGRLIPFYRLPRGLRFAEADVTAYLNSIRVEAVE